MEQWTNPSSAYDVNDNIGMMVDFERRFVTFYKNGILQVRELGI